jgi:hypothetical protein
VICANDRLSYIQGLQFLHFSSYCNRMAQYVFVVSKQLSSDIVEHPTASTNLTQSLLDWTSATLFRLIALTESSAFKKSLMDEQSNYSSGQVGGGRGI